MPSLGAQVNILPDVEMICVGLSQPRLSHFGVSTHHFISDADVIVRRKSENSTRAGTGNA